jgi:hypothetical protein
MMVAQFAQEMKRVDDADYFKDMMILHLDALTILYRDLLKGYAKLTLDENLFNETVSEMIVIMNHLNVKLEGCGDKTKDIVRELNEFSSWADDILIPKKDIVQMKRIHKLFRLILKAYDILGLSNY